jgi:uncharacterized protein YbjQ (UPF0145 family)
LVQGDEFLGAVAVVQGELVQGDEFLGAAVAAQSRELVQGDEVWYEYLLEDLYRFSVC